jgi:hypothetical protein
MNLRKLFRILCECPDVKIKGNFLSYNIDIFRRHFLNSGSIERSMRRHGFVLTQQTKPSGCRVKKWLLPPQFESTSSREESEVSCDSVSSNNALEVSCDSVSSNNALEVSCDSVSSNNALEVSCDSVIIMISASNIVELSYYGNNTYEPFSGSLEPLFIFCVKIESDFTICKR